MKRPLLLSLLLFAIPAAFAQQGVSSDGLQIKAVLAPVHKAVLASSVDGTVLRWNFKFGEQFKQGDVIFDIDDAELSRSFARAEGAMKEAGAASSFAAATFLRKEDLFKRGGAIGVQDFEQAKFDRDAAYERFFSAKATSDLAAIDLAFCHVKAPFNGRVVKRLKESHEFVRRGDPVAEIIEDDMLLAVVNLPASFFGKIQLGHKMSFRIDETSTIVSGEVYEVGGSIDPGSRTFQVRAVISNGSNALAAGMAGTLVADEGGADAGKSK